MLLNEDGLVDCHHSKIAFRGFGPAKTWFEIAKSIGIPFPSFSSLRENPFVKKLCQQFSAEYEVDDIDLLSLCGIKFWENLRVNNR